MIGGVGRYGVCVVVGGCLGHKMFGVVAVGLVVVVGGCGGRGALIPEGSVVAGGLGVAGDVGEGDGGGVVWPWEERGLGEGGRARRVYRASGDCVVESGGDGGDGGEGKGVWEAVIDVSAGGERRVGLYGGGVLRRGLVERWDEGARWARLVEMVNYDRGKSLRFVGVDDEIEGESGGGGLELAVAMDESSASWSESGVVVEDVDSDGERTGGGVMRGTARLRSWVVGRTADWRLVDPSAPAGGVEMEAWGPGVDAGGVVVKTELRVEVGPARLVRDVVRVYGVRDGRVRALLERSRESTKVFGIGGEDWCELVLERVVE